VERSSKSGQPAGLSILSSDLKIEGDLVSEGDLHISGSVTGDIVARRLTLDQGASITGSVKADAAVIGGNLAGRLTATSVTLGSTAHVAADVTHVSLVIEEGAVFQGQSRHVEKIEAATDDNLRPPLRLNAPKRAEPATTRACPHNRIGWCCPRISALPSTADTAEQRRNIRNQSFVPSWERNRCGGVNRPCAERWKSGTANGRMGLERVKDASEARGLQADTAAARRHHRLDGSRLPGGAGAHRRVERGRSRRRDRSCEIACTLGGRSRCGHGSVALGAQALPSAAARGDGRRGARYPASLWRWLPIGALTGRSHARYGRARPSLRGAIGAVLASSAVGAHTVLLSPAYDRTGKYRLNVAPR